MPAIYLRRNLFICPSQVNHLGSLMAVLKDTVGTLIPEPVCPSGWVVSEDVPDSTGPSLDAFREESAIINEIRQLSPILCERKV